MNRPRVRKFLLVGIVIMGFGFIGVGFVVPGVHWRLRVVGLKLQGKINSMDWGELLPMLRPGSSQYLKPLVDSPNPFGLIRNPKTSENDLVSGAEIFRNKCSICHGSEGRGGNAPELVKGNLKSGDSDWAIYRNIQHGIAKTAMPPFSLPDSEVWQLVAYIRSKARSNNNTPMNSSASQEVSEVSFPTLSYEQLRYPERYPGNWTTFSGSYNGQRHSLLKEINLETVKKLKVEWIHQLPSNEPIVEATPLVAGNIMYLSAPQNIVQAIDATTGNPLWTYSRKLPEQLSLVAGSINRGVALLGERVYLGTLDAHLIALDAKSGTLVWDVETAPYTDGYSNTAAPLAVKDKIIVGVSGGEFGIRGFLDAYDATSGRRVWRFNTVPGPGEAGHETWTGDSWKKGGGPTWMTGSFDPETNRVYWGVGNPSPLFRGDGRSGDNLYTNSVVALDVDTGKLHWYFQFTPHDLHDYDANQVPVLVDSIWHGKQRKLILSANKNGFFYVLDRETGTFELASPIARQNWAQGFDKMGRPVRASGSIPTERGTIVYPGGGGGANWWPPSYNPNTGLFYVPVLEKGEIFFRGEDEFRKGGFLLGGSTESIQAEASSWSALRAVKPETGELVWELQRPKRKLYGLGGTLSTAGGLIFWGEDREFMALDAKTGKMVWVFNTGGRIIAAPMTYVNRGRQFVTIAAGRAILTFSLAPS